jgi:NADH-quinone oxidoreductase subunit J
MTEEMLPVNVFFFVIAAMMVFSAIRVVTTKNVVHAALWLVGVLAGAAAQFILLASEFLGITQVLVYIGAIVVLFLFGIMLTRAELGTSDDLDNDRTQKFIAGGVALALAIVMGYVLYDAFEDQSFTLAGSTIGQLGQTTDQISDSIFSTYLVPFEAASVLLLAALIGAIVLARRD